ncbi:MAG: S41 family peptidase [Bacteroidales bacterium]
MNKKIYFLLPLFLAIAVIIGIYIGNKFNFISNESQVQLGGSSKMSALIDIIENKYVEEVSVDTLVEEAIPKIIAGLDPHSVYIPAKEFEAANEDLEGSFSGIGVQFSIMNDTVMIVDVVSSGPAEKVGLIAGDRIVNINDTAFVGSKVTNESVYKKLRGTKGSKVKLSIKRSTSKALLDFNIVRGDIPVNSIDITYQPAPGVGMIKVNKFGANTYAEFINSLAKLKKAKVNGIIIDLRGNSGGYMEAAINMINEFLPKDQLIVYTEGKSSPRSEARSNGSGSFKETPIVVLIDEWSASASEIFAGAIQDNDRGTIIGRRSYGKGLVQQQIPFYDGSAIRLTIARYHVPSGRCIQKEYKLGENENYQADILNRFMHGEFDSKDSIKQNEKLRYETIGGRTVYGGGGIMPDIFIPRDTTGMNSYFNTVVNRGIIYQFAFAYADKYRDELKQYKDFRAILSHLENSTILPEFVEYAAKKGVRRRPFLIEEAESLLLNQVYSYTARNILGENAFYPIFFKDDKAIAKAVELISSGKTIPVVEDVVLEEQPVHD